MANLFYITVTLLCLGVVFADDASNPVTQVEGTAKKLISQYNMVAMCPATCAGWCKLMDATCLRNCEKSNAACAATCTTLCGCFDKCNNNCDAAESCDGLSPAEAAGCRARNLSCKSECLPQCPLDFFPKHYMGELKDFDNSVGAMLQKVYQQMIDLESRP